MRLLALGVLAAPFFRRTQVMNQTSLLAVYLTLVAGSSLIGGALPLLWKLSHTWRQTMLSLVGGLMLGVAFLHLLPHACDETGDTRLVMTSALAGLLTIFLVIRVLRLHPPHHDEPHRCDGGAHWHVQPNHAGGDVAWLGVALGMGLHSFLDGVALAAAVAASHEKTIAVVPPALATFLAIVLHKPFDALAVTSLMAAEHWSRPARHLFNLGFASICPLGALAFYFGVGDIAVHHHAAVGVVLAFAAGMFICIALADLLPEVQFHSHDRLKLTIALAVGIAIAAAIALIEPSHDHVH